MQRGNAVSIAAFIFWGGDNTPFFLSWNSVTCARFVWIRTFIRFQPLNVACPFPLEKKGTLFLTFSLELAFSCPVNSRDCEKGSCWGQVSWAGGLPSRLSWALP